MIPATKQEIADAVRGHTDGEYIPEASRNERLSPLVVTEVFLGGLIDLFDVSASKGFKDCAVLLCDSRRIAVECTCFRNSAQRVPECMQDAVEHPIVQRLVEQLVEASVCCGRQSATACVGLHLVDCLFELGNAFLCVQRDDLGNESSLKSFSHVGDQTKGAGVS